jgi:osomolarity two-component system, phosphorelay intermediate protein YPD1
VTILYAIFWLYWSCHCRLTFHTPQSRDGPVRLSDHREVIELAAFEQILDMDDEDDNEFSRSIVYGFFEQAETTFDKMERAM